MHGEGRGWGGVGRDRWVGKIGGAGGGENRCRSRTAVQYEQPRRMNTSQITAGMVDEEPTDTLTVLL